ncbi:sigma-70 family RNA polymerase sigma factor [Nocardioides sp. W7]|uniref:sigma-70 family RNA polymerase sigma factor n=1 Tax=Nocardioides sp. W7 TaxID=2931390 RepID=UPI001FD50C2E|nr:sigma-70 family RNA polymerase sigma factor [Nocardioides sp. W7]
MRDPEEFDACYQAARTRLLLQTYALTGDLPAARSAVNDAFAVAWHHWRKANRHGDPESWIRPIAWSHAQRRHSARIWHREKGLAPEAQATLEALGKLSVDQRKILLLTVLATGTLADFAREVGLTREDAERELQTATSQLAIHLDLGTPVARALFDPLADIVADVRLPRASILRRAGAARRRTHTAVGVVVAVAALVVTGTVVTDTDGVHPTLDRDLQTAGQQGPRTEAPPPPPPLSEEALLSVEQVADVVPGRAWTEGSTHDNTAGDGLVLPCQLARYADSRGSTALVRDFATAPLPREPARSTTQLAEASASEEAAHRAFRTSLRWFAGCTEDRTQLLTTQRVLGVGDEAMVLTLRRWGAGATTLVAAVARTGQLTTTTVTSVAGTERARPRSAAQLLGTAVADLCTLPDAGGCGSAPELKDVPPLPVGVVPAMLDTVDLPPVSNVRRRTWAGTEPRQARTNLAATRCDDARFRGAGWSTNLTRTFLIPGAKLPAEFGLTQTVGALSKRRARAFVEDVRQSVRACPEEQLGTDVRQVADRRSADEDLTAWQVSTEVSDDRSVEYRMAIIRTGTAVAQIAYIPSADVRMTDDAFVALAERALQRLPRLPRPGR